MLLASGLFGYTMNKIGSIFQSMEQLTIEHKQKMSNINYFMKKKKIPIEL